jgi:hypothetical protein
MMILLPVVLNNESGLSDTSVAPCTISYNIGYVSVIQVKDLNALEDH